MPYSARCACASGALTTATVDETGKGQHRGAKAAPKWNAGVPSAVTSRCAAMAFGVFYALETRPQHLNKSRVEQRHMMAHSRKRMMVRVNLWKRRARE